MNYGLMATMICNNNMLCNNEFIFPQEFKSPKGIYRRRKDQSIISAPKINCSYTPITLSNTGYSELEKIVWDVLDILLSKQPTQLDLEMLSTMNDDIWDLF